MKVFYVYQYIRKKNTAQGQAGSPYYIGKGKGRRAWSKRHYGGRPNDPSQIQIVASDLAESDALQLEMFLIHIYGRADKGTGCLWNRTDGGEFTSAFRGNCGSKGRKHSAEAKEKMRLAKLGRKRGPNPAEWNNKISASLMGRTLSEDHVRKHADAMRGRKMPPRSPEHCEAIRRAKLGKPRPDKLSGSPSQLKAAKTRTGIKRGPYRKRVTTDGSY